MNFAVLDRENHTPGIFISDPDPAVLEGTGETGFRVGFIGLFDCHQRFCHGCVGAGNLAIPESLTGTDCIPPADFPWADADFFRQLVYIRFDRETALRHAKAAESTGRDVIGVNPIAVDVDVLIIIGPAGMRAGALQYRTS